MTPWWSLVRNLSPDLADTVPTSVKLSHDPGGGRVTGHVGTQRARGPGLDPNMGLKATASREPNPRARGLQARPGVLPCGAGAVFQGVPGQLPRGLLLTYPLERRSLPPLT